MKLLAGEYGRDPDSDVMAMWWRQMRHLTADEWISAIDAYLTGASTYHPHPGQILALANAAHSDQRQALRDEARRQEYATQHDTVAHDWVQRLRDEQTMATEIVHHLVTKLKLSRKDRSHNRLITSVIKHMMRCTCGPALAAQHTLCKTAHGLAGPGRTGQLGEAVETAQHLRAGGQL